MPENYHKQIDTSQSAVSEVGKKAEQKEETKELDAKLKANSATFFGAVDSIQGELETIEGDIIDPKNKSLLAGYGSEIQKSLESVARQGEKIYQAKINKKEAQGLESIDQQAEKINGSISRIREALPVLLSMEASEKQYKEKGKPALEAVKKIMDNQNLDPVKKKEQIMAAAGKSIDELAVSASLLRQIMPGTVPALFQSAYDQLLKSVNDGLVEMSKIQEYYAVREFASSAKYRQYLIFDQETGEIKMTDAYKKLPEEERQKMLLELYAVRKQITDQIEAKCANTEEEQAFFEGKDALAKGDWIIAKEKLLIFVKAGEVQPEDAARIPEAKEMLKQIARMELAQSQLRLSLIRSSIESRFASMGSDKLPIGTTHLMAKQFMGDMEEVLQKAQEMIEKGEALTIKEVHQKLGKIKTDGMGALARFQGGFQSIEGGNPQYNFVFDVLRTQTELNNEKDPKKRQEIILARAKQARDLGLPDLARHYYDTYFSEEISAAAKKVKRNDIAVDLATDSDAQAQLNAQMEALKKQVIEEYKKKNGADPSAEELNKILVPQKQKIMDMMVDKAYEKAVKSQLHQEMMAGSGVKAQEWKAAYGNTFVNLDTHDTKWYRTFYKFSDSEWNEFITMIWVDIAFMVASGGAGSAIARGLVGKKLASALAKKGISEVLIREAQQRGGTAFARLVISELGAAQATAYGVGSLAVESGVTHVMNGTLSGAARGDFSMYSSPETFFKSWGKMALMMGAGRVTNFGFSFMKPAESAFAHVARGAAEVVSDEAFSTVFELGLMAASGERITDEKASRIIKDNIVYAVGLRGANRLSGGLHHAEEGANTGSSTESSAVSDVAHGRVAPVISIETARAKKKAKAAESESETHDEVVRDGTTGEVIYISSESTAPRPHAVESTVDESRPPSERDRTSFIETNPALQQATDRARKVSTEEPLPEHDWEAERAFMKECEERYKTGHEQYQSWKEGITDPHLYILADKAQARERRARINQSIFAMEDVFTPADAMVAIERANAKREISPGADWEIIKNLESFDMAIVLAPDGQLHLFNSSANQYDFARHSQKLKGSLRSWEKLDPEARTSQILRHIEYLRLAFESGEISKEIRERILSRTDSEIREIFDSPTAEKIRKITPEQMKILREIVLKLRNEKFRVDRAAAREKANKTIELSSFIEKTMREQLERNPDITLAELHRILDLENNPQYREAKFDEQEKIKLKFVAESLFNKAKSIQSYFARFQNNPAALCEEIFGFRPVGAAKIGKSTFSLYFEFSDVRDYKRITGLETDRAQALPFGKSKIPSLDGSVVVIRNDEAMMEHARLYPTESIVEHEEQHNINKYVFRALQPQYHNNPTLDLGHETDPAKKLSIIEKYNEQYLSHVLIQAKDEIMAFTRNGLSPEEIKAKFRKNGPYDYWNQEHDDFISETLGTHMDDIVFQVFDQTARFGDRFRKTLNEAIDAAKRINDPGLLMITDIEHWRSLRLPEEMARKNEHAHLDAEIYTDTKHILEAVLSDPRAADYNGQFYIHEMVEKFGLSVSDPAVWRELVMYPRGILYLLTPINLEKGYLSGNPELVRILYDDCIQRADYQQARDMLPDERIYDVLRNELEKRTKEKLETDSQNILARIEDIHNYESESGNEKNHMWRLNSYRKLMLDFHNYFSGVSLSAKQFETATGLLINAESLLHEMESQRYEANTDIDKLKISISGFREILHRSVAEMNGFDPRQYNQMLRRFSAGSETRYDNEKFFRIADRSSYGKEDRIDLYEAVIRYKKAERIMQNERKMAKEASVNLDEFQTICTTENDKLFFEYLKGNIQASDFLKKITNDEAASFEEQGSHILISSVEKLMIFRKLVAIRNEILRDNMPEEEKNEKLSIVEEGLDILRGSRFGSFYSTGTNSSIWDGLVDTKGQLVSAVELRRRGIERRAGEGDLAGAPPETMDKIYGGIDVDGFGTARAYAEMNANVNGYLHPQHLNIATLRKRINIYKEAVNKMREEGISTIDIYPIGDVKLTKLELQLAQYERAMATKLKVGDIEEAPYPVIIGFGYGQIPVLGPRAYRSGISGEVIFHETIDLNTNIDAIYAPHSAISHVRGQLERIFGKERASKIKVYSLEAVDMVGYERGGPYGETSTLTYTFLHMLQDARINSLKKIHPASRKVELEREFEGKKSPTPKMEQETVEGKTEQEQIDKLYEQAHASRDMFDDLVATAGQDTGAVEIINSRIGGKDGKEPGLKSEDRVKCKLRFDHYRIEQVTDILRGTLVYDDMPSLERGVIALIKNPAVKKASIVNQMSRSGCNDYSLKIQLKTGFVTEVKVQIREVKEVGMDGLVLPESILAAQDYPSEAIYGKIVEDLKVKVDGISRLNTHIFLPKFGEKISSHHVYEILRNIPTGENATEAHSMLRTKLKKIRDALHGYAIDRYEQRTGKKFESSLIE